MNKKVEEYEAPEMEILVFEVEDVITTSTTETIEIPLT